MHRKILERVYLCVKLCVCVYVCERVYALMHTPVCVHTRRGSGPVGAEFSHISATLDVF